jgi:signal transduction histidine kinase
VQALRPRHWPVRWRLALASAALTLAILLVFAAVVGHLVSERIRSDFNRELRATVSTLAPEVRIQDGLTGTRIVGEPDFANLVLPADASVRLYDAGGGFVAASPRAPDLGPLVEGVRDLGALHVATTALISPETDRVAGYLQYARSEARTESTIERLWLFIAAGVLGGTLLASLAGLAIADRAMRPVASLTAAAREIAATRDPSRKMLQTRSDDEVGELGRTLEQMLRALDAARTEREGAMQKQREFVADASHELRTPLTSVIANLELLQASLPQQQPSEGREMVDSALRSSQRMTRLVADLLLLARADAGRIGERTRCDIAEIAGNAATEVAVFSGDRRLAIYNGESIAVDGNPDELHRMVLNLLENAVRHTPSGSRVELSLQRRDPEGQVSIEVADDGPGVPQHARDQIFERFARGSGPADVAGGSGTGLGLAIVRAVARSHGGEVEVLDSASGGALFRVVLPLANSEQVVTPPLRAL